VHRRVRTWPPVGNVVGEHEGRSPGVVSAPALGFIEGVAIQNRSFSAHAKLGYPRTRVKFKCG
jgi:hypothetical protein